MLGILSYICITYNMYNRNVVPPFLHSIIIIDTNHVYSTIDSKVIDFNYFNDLRVIIYIYIICIRKLCMQISGGVVYFGDRWLFEESINLNMTSNSQ